MKGKLKEKVFTSLLMYVLLFFITLYFYYIGNIEKYAIGLVIGLLIFLIKDILIYFVEFKEIREIKISKLKLKRDYQNGILSFGDYYLFLNRNYFFPIALVLYLVYILLYQIDIINIKESLYTLINSNFLGIVVISGVLTTFKEDIDKTYQRKVKSFKGLYKNLILSSFLSIIGSYIIILQTNGLGFLSYLIGLISGLLIFLVGVSMLEEE